MSEADSLPSPATPLAKPRGGRVLDAYGFEVGPLYFLDGGSIRINGIVRLTANCTGRSQVREEFVELHEEHESIWREEEDERVQRWDVFLQELNDRYGSG